MVLNEILKLGEIVDIRIGDVTAKSKIQDFLDGNRFVVLPPTQQMIPVPIGEAEEVDIIFYQSSGVYSFTAILEGRMLRDNLPMYVFRAASEVKRDQRRHGFRLPVVLNAIVRVRDENNDIVSGDIHAKTINLSERGVLIASNTVLPLGCRLTIQLKLEKLLLILPGVVVRIEPPEKRGDRQRMAIQFVDCTQRDLAQVSRFIMRRQLHDRHVKSLLD